MLNVFDLPENCADCAWWFENGDGTQRICSCTDEQVQDESSNVDERPSTSNAEPSGNEPNSASEGPSANEGSFPEDGDDGDIENPAIPWRELPQHRWYLVAGVRDVKSKWGWSKLLDLNCVNGECFTVWATGLIKASIDSKWKRKAGARLFIKSIGARASSTGPFTYYDYKYKTVA